VRGELSVKRNLTAVWISREDREKQLGMARRQTESLKHEHLRTLLMDEF
jgi:hypothetical protein